MFNHQKYKSVCQKYKSICNNCLIRLAFEGLSTAIILTDERCRLIFVNRAAKEIFDISETNIGQPIQRVMKDFSLLSLWSEARQRKEPIIGLIRVTYPTERLLRITIGICSSKRGTVIGRALLACDVTEDRRVALEVTEELARTFLKHYPLSTTSDNLSLDALTPTEWRILRLLGKGLSNQQISDELTISHNTLRTHLKNIYRKLNLPNRSAAVAFAAQLRQFLPHLTFTLLGE